jgi:RNA methyltransferase, TrmH family
LRVNRPIEDIISSKKNPTIVAIEKLGKSRSERTDRGLFLFEGTHALTEAIACRWPLESILATPSWLAMNGSIVGQLGSQVTIIWASDEVVTWVATTERPDGVITIAKQRGAGLRDRSVDQNLRLGIALEAIQDPGNVGTLLRSAVAASADCMALGAGSVDIYHPKLLRATAGQWFRLQPRSVELLPSIERWRAAGIQVLAAAAGGTEYWKLDMRRPTMFVLGNEGAGLSKTILGACDQIVSIPMASGVESLNVGMTGTLLLYEALRQQRRQDEQ